MRTRTNTQLINEPKYRTWTCANRQEIIDIVNRKHSIYLYGDVGTGKTHFLYYIANQYNLRGHQVFVILSATVHDELIREIRHNKATSEIMISVSTKMRDAELLMWDDIGNEQMTDFLHEHFQKVLDYRYINKLPIYITSNYSVADLYEKWLPNIGEFKAKQLCDRIKTFGAVEIKGKNWRNNE